VVLDGTNLHNNFPL